MTGPCVVQVQALAFTDRALIAFAGLSLFAVLVKDVFLAVLNRKR